MFLRKFCIDGPGGFNLRVLFFSGDVSDTAHPGIGFFIASEDDHIAVPNPPVSFIATSQAILERALVDLVRDQLHQFFEMCLNFMIVIRMNQIVKVFDALVIKRLQRKTLRVIRYSVDWSRKQCA